MSLPIQSGSLKLGIREIIRMQLQSNTGTRIYKNSLDCFMQVAKKEGVKGLYRGLSASLIGMSESTFQFVMYEYFKQTALKKRLASGESPNLCKFF